MHPFPMVDSTSSIPATVPARPSESIMKRKLLRHFLGVVFACVSGATLAAGLVEQFASPVSDQNGHRYVIYSAGDFDNPIAWSAARDAAAAAGGYLDTVDEGVTGVHVDLAEPGPFLHGIESALAHPWDRDAIRAHAATFSEERFAERIRAVLQEV